MTRKPKFRPTITKVKLNPEQAVLTCGCYRNNTFFQFSDSSAGGAGVTTYCGTLVTRAKTGGVFATAFTTGPCAYHYGKVSSADVAQS